MANISPIRIFSLQHFIIMDNIQQILDFLSDLKENNNREWFNENKSQFLSAKEAFEALTQKLIDRLQLEDESIQGLQAKDCIFRIYRDVRFSKDKSPYKTHMGAYISQGGRKSEMCGYYFHLEPGDQSMLAGGLYAPSSPILFEVRDAIYADTEEFKAIIEHPDFIASFGHMQGDKLKLAPKGFPKDFEEIEWLKHKTFLALHKVSDKALGNANFMDRAMTTFRHLQDFNEFFNRAIREIEK